MKKIFKYLSILLTVALLGSFTACNLLQEPLEESAEVGLGIKVFFPTKVVAGQPMTINGSGFAGVKEIVFPGDVVVTDFELVSGEMIRVNAPAGIAADGGMIKVVAEDGEAVSRVPLTLGSTSVSGFSRPEGSTFTGGENLEIYGSDLQFICEVEVPDPDGNPMILGDECFYRKGENKVVITLPKKVFKGSYVGKVRTFDGKEFLLPEYVYEPGAEGGHWEKKKVFIWQNPDPAGLGNANWNGLYRFCLEGKDTNPAGKECIAEIPAETWEKMKTEKFYITFSHDDWFQVRIVTGWWNCQWPEGKEKDITPSYLTDMLIDNGDGTYTVELDLKDSELAANIDVEHLLFTGSGYTPLELYFQEEVWVGGESGPKEVDIWKNADPAGLGNANWNGLYRFCLEGKDTNPAGKECIAEIPAETWEKMKTEKFYITFSHDDWFQVRIVTGWWNCQWPEGKEKDITPSYLTDMLIDNGDGTYSVEINLKDTELAASMDVEHLLFTGSGYTPLRLYFVE